MVLAIVITIVACQYASLISNVVVLVAKKTVLNSVDLIFSQLYFKTFLPSSKVVMLAANTFEFGYRNSL